MNWLLVVILFLSFAGFFLAFRTFLTDNIAFFPILFVAVATVISYVFGLIGLLKIGSIIVLGLGLVLIPFSVIKQIKDGNKSLLKLFIEPSLLFLIIGIIWAFFITRNVGFSHPDDFSHWYKICKVLHADNAFPTNIDIRFTTYTPGTATWIYFFTNAVGFNVPNCLWAQSIIHVACLCSLFILIPSEASKVIKTILYVGICMTSILLCSIDVSTYSLLVDCTLPLIALTVVFYLYCHRFLLDCICTLVVIVLMSFMELIKFSGLIFALFIMILYLMEGMKQPKEKRLLKVFVAFVSPVLITLLYRVRNSFIYSNINLSNQAVSFERYNELFSDKSTDSVIKTIVNVFAMAFNPTGKYAQVSVVWICFFLLIVLVIIQKKKLFGASFKADYFRILKYTFLVYFIYVFFLTLTYLFSMNAYEAETLSCCFRYMGSVAVFIVGLFCYHIMKSLVKQNDKNIPIKMAVYIIMTFVFGFLMFGYGYVFEGKQQYSPYENFTDSTPWNKISEYAEEKMEFTDERYLVIWDETYLENSHYVPFQVDYVSGSYLRSVKIKTIMISEIDENAELISQYDSNHIIVVGELNE